MSQPAALGYFSWKQCSGVNDKFRYRLVSLDFLVLWHQGKRTGTLLEVIGFIVSSLLFFTRVISISRELVNLLTSISFLGDAKKKGNPNWSYFFTREIIILWKFVNLLTSIWVILTSIHVCSFSLLKRLLRRFKTKGSLGRVHSSPCGRRMQKRKDTLASEFFAR